MHKTTFPRRQDAGNNKYTFTIEGIFLYSAIITIHDGLLEVESDNNAKLIQSSS